MGRLDGKVALITGAGGGMGRVAASCSPPRARGWPPSTSSTASDDRRSPCSGRRRGHLARPPTSPTPTRSTRPWRTRSTPSAACTSSTTTPGSSLADDDGAATTPEATWDTTMEVNVTGMWHCCRAGIPAMLELAAAARSSTCASFVAHMGAATPQLAYTTSKGAVLAMTREIAVIYAREGIRANALCPGPVLTPLLAKYLDRRREAPAPPGAHPDGPLRHRPRRWSNGALFLASDESSFMTGQSLLDRRRHHRRLHHPGVSADAQWPTTGRPQRRRTCARAESTPATSTPCSSLPRHAGPPHGQAGDGPYFCDSDARRHDRGVQLPAGRRRRHDAAARATGSPTGSRATATSRRCPTWPPCGWCPGSSAPPLVLCDLVDEHDRRTGRGLAPPGAARPGGAGRRAGLHGQDRRRAGVLPVQGHLRARPRPSATTGLGPHSDWIEDYHILQTTRDEYLIREIRNGMEAAGVPVEFSKGEAGQGQHEINLRLRRGARDGRPPHDLQERRQGDRRPARPVAHLHGQVRHGRRRAPRATSTPASGTGNGETSLMCDDRRRPRRTSRRRSATGWAGSWPRRGSWRWLFAPTVNSYKRFQPDSWAPTAIAWGDRQPHLRAAHRRPRRRPPGGVPHPRRRRQPLPGLRRRRSPPASTASSTSIDPGPRLRGQRLRGRRRRAHPVDARRGDRACWRAARWPGPRSGDDVHHHLLNTARQEWLAANRAVTDWERRRYFAQY